MKKEKDHKKQFLSNVVIILVVAILLIGTIVLYIKSFDKPIKTFEDYAESLCDLDSTLSVSICNNQVIEIKRYSLDSPSEFHHRDGTLFNCPIVAPDATSSDCKAIFNAKQTNEWNCVKVC